MADDNPAKSLGQPPPEGEKLEVLNKIAHRFSGGSLGSTTTADPLASPNPWIDPYHVVAARQIPSLPICHNIPGHVHTQQCLQSNQPHDSVCNYFCKV